MPAGVPPKGGVNARIGFPINMAGLGWTAMTASVVIGKDFHFDGTKTPKCPQLTIRLSGNRD